MHDYVPECVLLDIDMPGMGGIEVARQLRKLYGRDLVLIAVTGWGDEDLRVSPSG